jgi:hypothetical protein
MFAACTKASENPNVQYGPTTETGTLVPVDISLLRRGTHALIVDGLSRYYVESKTINLRSFEGQTVFIEGELEANTHASDLPVLVAKLVKTPYGDGSLHLWVVPALGIKIQAPQGWTAKIEKGTVSFSLPGEVVPLLTFTEESSLTLPQGTPLFVGGHRGVRTTTQGNGPQDVFVQQGTGVLHVHFDASLQQAVKRLEEAQVLLAQFERILSALRFSNDDTAVTGSGTGIGAACGGAGGILCPQGSFCNITDVTTKTGTCRTQ